MNNHVVKWCRHKLNPVRVTFIWNRTALFLSCRRLISLKCLSSCWIFGVGLSRKPLTNLHPCSPTDSITNGLIQVWSCKVTVWNWPKKMEIDPNMKTASAVWTVSRLFLCPWVMGKPIRTVLFRPVLPGQLTVHLWLNLYFGCLTRTLFLTWHLTSDLYI